MSAHKLQSRPLQRKRSTEDEEKTSQGGNFLSPPGFNLTAAPPVQQKSVVQKADDPAKKVGEGEKTKSGAEKGTADPLAAGPQGVCTEYGNFTIYPDDFIGPLPLSERGGTSWPIRRSAYTNLMAKLGAVKGGTSQISITGSAEFKTATYLDLGWLMTSAVGQDLINQLAAAGKTVNIIETGGGNATSYSPGADSWETTDTPPQAGPGSNVTVKFNPNKLSIGDGSEVWHTRPPAIGLAHEMIHAWTGVYGRRARGETDGVRNREMQATGLGAYSDARLTENKFRAQFGLPQREEY